MAIIGGKKSGDSGKAPKAAPSDPKQKQEKERQQKWDKEAAEFNEEHGVGKKDDGEGKGGR